jgi:pentatricopeptide repeat protein
LYSRALSVTRNNWIIWNNLGVAYLKSHRYTEAIPAFRETLRIKPDYSPARENLSTAYSSLTAFYFEQGQREKAIEVYEQLRRFDARKGDVIKGMFDVSR